MSTQGSSQYPFQGRISKVLAVALLTGGVAAAALMLATQLRAQTPPPAAAPPPPAATPAPPPPAAPPSPIGSVPMTEIPFYADWAGSAHANKKAEPFNHWNKEGVIPADCARCHSTPGFRDYVGADGSTPFQVDHPAPIGTVITCVACHNDKTVRLSKVIFPSGITVDHLGPEARCMTCHQGRESTASVNKAIAGIPDDQITPKLDFINVHYAAAGATLFGGQVQVGYQYPGKTYAGRFMHKEPYVTCTNCHDQHTLEVKVNDCAACHKEVTDKASLHMIRTSKVDRDGNGDVKDGVAQEIVHLRGKLLAAIQDYAKSVSKKPVVYDAQAYPYFFNDKNGNSQTDKGEAIFPNRYKAWTPRLLKAAYNYQFVTKDPGAFAHNGPYAIELLQDSLNDLGSKVKVDLGKAVRP
jgi:hypothetical protein